MEIVKCIKCGKCGHLIEVPKDVGYTKAAIPMVKAKPKKRIISIGNIKGTEEKKKYNQLEGIGVHCPLTLSY